MGLITLTDDEMESLTDADLERLRDEFETYATKLCKAFFVAGRRRGFERGKAIGASQTRDALLRALQEQETRAAIPPVIVPSPPQTQPELVQTAFPQVRTVEEKKPEQVPPADAVQEYGAISKHVRSALRILDWPGGVGPQEIEKLLKSDGVNIEIGQIRTALKVLAKQGEISRVERGKYRIGLKDSDSAETIQPTLMQ